MFAEADTGRAATWSVLLVVEATSYSERLREIVGRLDGLAPVFETRTLRQALSALGAFAPGLVVVDLGLLRESALPLIESAQSIRPRPVTVVLTSTPDLSDRRLCVAAGADYFFTKLRPIAELEELLRRIVRGERERARSGEMALAP